jgi:hypothetical protein
MDWNFIPANGAARGILVGIKSSQFNILSWQELQYSTITMIRNSTDNFIWRLVVVHGSPYDEKKLEFINELHMVMVNL